MKASSRKLLLLILLFLMSLALHFLFQRQQGAVQEETKIITQSLNRSKQNVPPNEKDYRIPEIDNLKLQSNWFNMNKSGAWETNEAANEYFRRTKSDRNYDWKRAISFFGIVLDDQDKPIEGVKIHFVWSDLSKLGTSESWAYSDQSGRFNLSGAIGKGVSISASKDGYRRCRWGVIGFEYANPTDRAYHQPDPERPVLFRLIKMGPPEPLVQRSRMSFRCAEDSGDLHLDLLGQRQVGADDPEVDLIVHAEHGPIREVDGRRWFDWKVVLSVPNGGLLAGTECPPAAPEDGYLPRLEFQGKVEGRYSMDGVDDWFFLKSRDGRHFGRVHLKVSAAPDGGGAPKVYLAEYVLNPAGSRGLEFYPEMDVSVKYYAPR